MDDENVGRTEVDTECVKCKNCGSNMVFNPDTQMLRCDRCGYEEDFGKSDELEEISIDSALGENAVWRDEALTFRCENCGANIVAAAAETASVCPFCGASHVVAEDDLQGIKPNGVLPFRFGKDEAVAYFKKWAKKHVFAPDVFRKKVSPEKMRGVYMPCFTFDSNTDSVYRGRVGYTHTRTVHTSKGTRTETYTVWRNISGSFSHFFNDVMVNAGKRMEEKKAAKLAPFDFTGARVYESEYLVGFVAHRYEKDIRTCWDEAKRTMDARLRSMIISRYSCDKVDYLNVSTHHSGVTYKYLLLPVYVINYKYKKSNYVIYQNGSTGKTVGKAPVSVWKVLAAVAAGVAALVGLFFLFRYLLS